MFLAKDCRMIRPLEYGSGLSLEKAEARLIEIREGFEIVKAHYSGFWFKRNMGEQDKSSLTDYIGVLLFPLGLEKSVWYQVTQAQREEDTLRYQTGQLLAQIMDFLEEFENTYRSQDHYLFNSLWDHCLFNSLK